MALSCSIRLYPNANPPMQPFLLFGGESSESIGSALCLEPTRQDFQGVFLTSASTTSSVASADVSPTLKVHPTCNVEFLHSMLCPFLNRFHTSFGVAILSENAPSLNHAFLLEPTVIQQSSRFTCSPNNQPAVLSSQCTHGADAGHGLCGGLGCCGVSLLSLRVHFCGRRG